MKTNRTTLQDMRIAVLKPPWSSALSSCEKNSVLARESRASREED